MVQKVLPRVLSKPLLNQDISILTCSSGFARHLIGIKCSSLPDILTFAGLVCGVWQVKQTKEFWGRNILRMAPVLLFDTASIERDGIWIVCSGTWIILAMDKACKGYFFWLNLHFCEAAHATILQEINTEKMEANEAERKSEMHYFLILAYIEIENTDSV